MEITYLGHSCFKIKAKAEFAKQTVTIITDPYDPTLVGFSFAKQEADILTVSHQHPDHNFIAKINDGYFLIDQPGEYEVSGISVLGYSVDHDDSGGISRGKNNIYVIEAEGYRVCHLGDLGRTLSDNELSELGVIDTLLLPVGDISTLSIKEARDLVNKISPTAVIPMHFFQDGMNANEFAGLKKLDEFLSLCVGLKQDKVDRYTVERSVSVEPKIVLLSRKS